VLHVQVEATAAPRTGMVRSVLPAVPARAAAAARPPPDPPVLWGDERLLWPAGAAAMG
jgi:hypothetical protein